MSIEHANCLLLGGELTASSLDVEAASHSNGVGDAALGEHSGEFSAARFRRSLSGEWGCGIERNQVDVTSQSPDQRGEGLRLFRAIVETLDQSPLECNPASSLINVGATCSKQGL